MSTYAIIPQEQWEYELVERFPHAPLVQNCRVLVFADRDTAELKEKYAGRVILDEADSSITIQRMLSGLEPWVVCQVEPLREVLSYFSPPNEYI